MSLYETFFLLFIQNIEHECRVKKYVMACSPGFMGNATNEKSEGRLEKGKWGTGSRTSGDFPILLLGIF